MHMLCLLSFWFLKFGLDLYTSSQKSPRAPTYTFKNTKERKEELMPTNMFALPRNGCRLSRLIGKTRLTEAAPPSTTRLKASSMSAN